MSRFDGNIVIGTSVDVGGIGTGLKKITSGFNKLASTVQNNILTKIFSDAASAASDLIEVQNIVDVTFEDMAWKAERFSNIAIETFGMSELSAKQTAGSFMAMGRAMELGSENASNMAIALTGLTGDFASFYNISQEYARVALSAVYTGETETLKRYGIILTEANLQQFANNEGIEKNVKLMSAREKAILRYQYVMKQASFIQGDFVRTQDSWANQTRLLGQAWNQFLIVLGQGVTTVLIPFIRVLNQIIIKLKEFTQLVLVILGNIFGIDFSMHADDMSGFAESTEDAADAEEELADNIGKASKAAWKALAPFDELNVLRTPSSGGGGAGGGADIFADWEAMIPFDLPEKVQEIIDSAIDNLYDFGRFLSQTIIDILDGIDWNLIWTKARKIGKNVAEFLNGLFNPEMFYKIAKTIANGFNTIIHTIEAFADEFDFEQLGEAIGEFINGFVDNFDWERAGKTIKKIVRGVEKLVAKLVKTVRWKKLVEGIFKLLKEIPWEVYISALLALVGFLVSKLITKVILPIISQAISMFVAIAMHKFVSWLYPIIESGLMTIGKKVLQFILGLFAKKALHTGLAAAGESASETFAGGFFSKLTSLFKYSKVVEPVEGFENGVESATGFYKVVLKIWETLQSIGTWFVNLQGMDIVAIFGGEAGIAGGAVAVAEIIAAAIAGYFTGKDLLGPFLTPEDKDWYKNFSFFGDDGLFKTVINNFSSLGEAINQMYTDLDGIAFYIDPITSLGESIEKLVESIVKGDKKGTSESIFTTILSAINTLIPPLTAIELILNRFLPDDIKEKVEGFFDNLATKIVEIRDKVATKVSEIWTIVSGFFKGLWEDFVTFLLTPIINGVTAVWNAVYGIIYRIGQIIYGFYIIWHAYFVLLWQDIVEGVIVVKDAIVNKATEIWNFVSGVAEKIWTAIKTGIEFISKIVKNVVDTIKNYLTVFWTFMQGVLTSIWTAVSTTLTTIWNFIYNNFITPIVTIITTTWTFILQVLNNLWTEAQRIFTLIWTAVKTTIIDPVKNTVTTAWSFIKTNFVDPMVNGITTAIGILQSVAETLWEGLKSGVKGFANFGIGIVESMLNHIIDSINNFLNFFNGAVQMASSITGDPWTNIATLNHVSIPRLANGAVIPPNAPFMALLGDQKKGTNIEAPLETIKQALIETLASTDFGGRGNIVVKCVLDGREIAEAVADQNDIYRQSKGRSMFA